MTTAKLTTGGRFRFLLAGWAILEMMLFGGLINGWASLVFVLKEDGLYADLCARDPSFLNVTGILTTAAGTGLQQTEEPEVSCKEQDENLNLWYTIAVAFRSTNGIFIGIHIFKFGTRSARLTGWFFFTVGALMMAFADKTNPWLVAPSLATLSYGGVTLLLTNVEISCLFPGAACVIVTLVSGAYDFSAITQLAVKMFHEYGVMDRLYFYVGLGGLHAVMVLSSTLIFMPKALLVPETDNTLQVEPKHPDLRKRPDSMYDRSKINVHTSHNSLRCTVCKDGSSYGEQKEQLLKNSEVGSEALSQKSLPKKYLKENQCICKQQFTTLSADGLDLLDKKPDLISVGTTKFPCTRKIVTTTSPQLCWSTIDMPTAGHEERPRFHSPNGIHCSNSMETETQEKLKQGITMTSFQGKFISVIHVGSPPNKPWGCEASDPCQQETAAERDSTTVAESGDDVSDSQVLANGRHVILDLKSDDHQSAGASSLGESCEVGEVRNVERKEGEAEGGEQLYRTLKSCLRSEVYWMHVIWASCNVLRLVAFFGFLNTKLTTMFNGDKEKVSFYTNLQAYFAMSVMAVCWISGVLYDWQTSRFKGRKSGFERQVLPGSLPLALTSLVGVAISVCWMIDMEPALYIMFGLLNFYNTFILGICISFLLKVFPVQYFGILNGLLAIIVGSFSFLQYAIFTWHNSYPDGPFHVEVFLLILVTLSLAHPAYIVCKSILLARAMHTETLRANPKAEGKPEAGGGDGRLTTY